MPQINRIKELRNSGYTQAQIARELSIDEKTVRSYLKKEDFSPKKPKLVVKPSKLDPFKEQINTWLTEDQNTWRKQRHTAQRVYDRLCKDKDFNCSYPTVQRYVRVYRRQQLNRTKAASELVWYPGEAQADFGEADCIYQGTQTRLKYLVVTFPYSNVGFTQFFHGENAECVCQGLKDIFMHINGSVPRLVVDNATGIGRRMGERIRMAKLFEQFKAHYNMTVIFCNTDSGHEKGSVENKVGTVRRNEFVPLPVFSDIQTFNRQLFERTEEMNNKNHYKKHQPVLDLFKDDLSALLTLPSHPFDVCRYVYKKTNKYGNVQIDGDHHYSSRPEYGLRDVLVGIRAHTIDLYDDTQQVLVTHQREYGKQRTDSIDYRTSLAMVMKNIGSWHNSGLRTILDDTIKDYIDQLDRLGQRAAVRTLHSLTNQYSFDVADYALSLAITQDGEHPLHDAAAFAARIAYSGLDIKPTTDPDLKVYDEFISSGSPA